ELCEARRLLEPAIAALAARRATGGEISEMERILAEQAREVASGRTGMAQDSSLHAAIAAAAHNRAILRIVSALIDLLGQSREEGLLTPGPPPAPPQKPPPHPGGHPPPRCGRRVPSHARSPHRRGKADPRRPRQGSVSPEGPSSLKPPKCPCQKKIR